MTPYSVIASPDLSGRSNVAAASCHCEAGEARRSNLGGDNRDCHAPACLLAADSSRRAKPWPACAKALAKASGQVARNDKGEGWQ